MNFDESPKPKKKCCIVIPQEPWIKLWFIWAIVPIISMIGPLTSEPRDAMAYLPVMGTCFFLVLLMALILFHYGFDTYGGRITIFSTSANRLQLKAKIDQILGLAERMAVL